MLNLADVDTDKPGAMTPEQARKIIDFAIRNDHRMLFIHCVEGYSTAATIGGILNWYCNCSREPDSYYQIFKARNRGNLINTHVRDSLLRELRRRYGSLANLTAAVRLRRTRERFLALLTGFYTKKIFAQHPQLVKWLKKFPCVSFSVKAVSGDPEVLRLAQGKFLHSGCSINCCNGNILVIDTSNTGRMQEIFSRMLELAVPESYAVKGENYEDFFAPFAEKFNIWLYKNHKYFLKLLKHSPKDAAIALLAEKQFKYANIFGKQAFTLQSRKFNKLYAEYKQHNV